MVTKAISSSSIKVQVAVGTTDPVREGLKLTRIVGDYGDLIDAVAYYKMELIRNRAITRSISTSFLLVMVRLHVSW